MDEVLCDVDPLEFFYVLLGQRYLWKCQDMYELRPRTLFGKYVIQNTKGSLAYHNLFDLC